jgi:hypothetical protein
VTDDERLTVEALRYYSSWLDGQATRARNRNDAHATSQNAGKADRCRVLALDLEMP